MKSVKKTIAQRTAIKNKLADGKIFFADVALFQKYFPTARLNNDLRRVNKYNEDRLQKQVLYALLEKVGEDEILENRAFHSKEYATLLKAKRKAEAEAAKKAESDRKAAEAAAKKAAEEAEKMAAEEAEKKAAEEASKVDTDNPEVETENTEVKSEGETPESTEVKTEIPTSSPEKVTSPEIKKKNAGASKKSSQK